jgi:hypothetical protein
MVKTPSLQQALTSSTATYKKEDKPSIISLLFYKVMYSKELLHATKHNNKQEQLIILIGG